MLSFSGEVWFAYFEFLCFSKSEIPIFKECWDLSVLHVSLFTYLQTMTSSHKVQYRCWSRSLRFEKKKADDDFNQLVLSFNPDFPHNISWYSDYSSPKKSLACTTDSWDKPRYQKVFTVKIRNYQAPSQNTSNKSHMLFFLLQSPYLNRQSFGEGYVLLSSSK